MHFPLKYLLVFIFLVFTTPFAQSFSNLKHFCTISDQTTFDSLLSFIGYIHKNYYQELNYLVVFNGGLTSDQIQVLSQIEKVKIFNIAITDKNEKHIKQLPLLLRDQIKDLLSEQLEHLFPNNCEIVWIQLPFIVNNSLATSIQYKKIGNEKPFVIVIPSYNNEEWYYNNLLTAVSQNYSNYRIIYINDASRDNTLLGVQQFKLNFDKNNKIQLINNSERIGALANFYRAIYLCEPWEIVIMLDGDDWLPDENVLSYLNTIYQDPNVWITYGQYKEYPSNYLGIARELPSDIIKNNSYREFDWVTSALRTFYASLFHKIKRADLMHEGKFYAMAWDLAIMFPTLEMGGDHSRFISKIIYTYNRATPINDNKVNVQLQLAFETEIRKKPRYSVITYL